MIISFTNLKGGVGKTTIATNIAVCLAHIGYKVLLVDADSSKNALTWFGVRPSDKKPQLWVIGASDERSLKKVVDQWKNEYDVIIIDGIGSAMKMNLQIINTADLLFIPTRPQVNDLWAMDDLVPSLNTDSTYFIINEFNERADSHQSLQEAFHLQIPNVGILKNTIKSRVAYGIASAKGIGVYEYSNAVAKDEIVKLTNEILKIAKQHSLIK